MKLGTVIQKAQQTRQRLLHPYCAAILVAAGTARRMGGRDKILLPLDGRSALSRCLQTFNRNAVVDEIVVVTRPELLEPVSRLCAHYPKARMVVPGGASRTDSVLLGLEAVSQQAQLVAVHDGARPLVPDEVITKAVRKAAKFGAAAPAIPVKDTIKVSTEDGIVDQTPPRRTLFAVQTPQVFDAELLRAALQRAKETGVEATDDCSAVEALGMKVHLTDGSEENIKLTTPLDIDLAEAILARRKKKIYVEASDWARL